MIIPYKYEFYFVFRDFIVTIVCFLSFCCDVLFVCHQFRRAKHIQSTRDNKSDYGRQYVVKLESHKYSSHYGVVSSFVIFSDLVFAFLSIYC